MIAETHHAAAACGVQHIHEASRLRDCVRLAAARRNTIRQQQARSNDSKYGQATAPRIDREQRIAVLAQRERSLRGERIDRAAAAAPTGVVLVRASKSAVGCALERDHFVGRGVVGHDEYGMAEAETIGAGARVDVRGNRCGDGAQRQRGCKCLHVRSFRAK